MLPLMMHNMRPGQVPVRFNSTTTKVTAIPMPPMVMEVIRERIMCVIYLFQFNSHV